MSIKRNILSATAILAVCVGVSAQTTTNSKKSFDEFRKSMLDNYQQYRSQVLENYAQYLDGIWDDFTKFQGEVRDSVPKPKAAPVCFEDNPYTQPSLLPDKKPEVKEEPVIPKTKPKTEPKKTEPKQEPVKEQPKQEPVKEQPKQEPVKEQPKQEPVKEQPKQEPVKEQPKQEPVKEQPKQEPVKEQPKQEPVKEQPKQEPVKEQPKQEPVKEQPKQEPKKEEPKPTPTVTPTPTLPAIPAKPEKKIEPKPVPTTPVAGPKFDFSYYGMNIEVPQVTLQIKDAIASPKEYSQHWEKLDKEGKAVKVAQNLDKKAKEMNLNPYLTFVLVKNWVDKSFPSTQASSRMSLTHFLLANMGFDARISITGSGEAVLLMPSNQTIYSRPYLMIDNRRYYIFPDNDANIKNLDMRFSTCRLPKDADLGKVLDLQIHNLNIPYKAKPYTIEYGGMKLEGEVNGNLLPMLKNYPQMDMPNYSASLVDPNFRKDVVNQVSAQLNGMQQTAAVNKLLQFIQKGFDYATDHAYHGFEKPYFFEEMMLYDKCDCEDRAIFYTYLLWNVLGVKNHMINYPGHESVAVCLDEPVQGTSYQKGGNTYYISDPTYIGSRTGQCMPNYEKTAPRIDYEYK